jgi:hypothetical protein
MFEEFKSNVTTTTFKNTKISKPTFWSIGQNPNIAIHVSYSILSIWDGNFKLALGAQLSTSADLNRHTRYRPMKMRIINRVHAVDFWPFTSQLIKKLIFSNINGSLLNFETPCTIFYTHERKNLKKTVTNYSSVFVSLLIFSNYDILWC